MGKKNPNKKPGEDKPNAPDEVTAEATPLSKVAKPAKPRGGMNVGLEEQMETEKVPPLPKSELQRTGHIRY